MELIDPRFTGSELSSTINVLGREGKVGSRS